MRAQRLVHGIIEPRHMPEFEGRPQGLGKKRKKVGESRQVFTKKRRELKQNRTQLVAKGRKRA